MAKIKEQQNEIVTITLTLNEALLIKSELSLNEAINKTILKNIFYEPATIKRVKCDNKMISNIILKLRKSLKDK